MFKPFTVTLHRVRDRVKFTEGGESLLLSVDADAMRMVVGLNQAQKRLTEISEESPVDEQQEAARYFASVIFGAEQAEKLMDFYRHDPACVIGVCGRYFTLRLNRLIYRAQKKAR
jgi:hypothetical protein